MKRLLLSGHLLSLFLLILLHAEVLQHRRSIFLLGAESKNPSPRPPKLRVWSKAKQILSKGCAQAANASQKDFQAT